MAKLDILIRAENQTSGPIGQIKKALNGLGGAAAGTLAAAGVAAAGAVTAITGAVAIGVGKAADLEQGVADIASVMGLTMEQAKPLGDLIQNLGMDPKLKVDAIGASDAIMQLAQSGVSMSDIMAGAARNTVLLANATGGDMATSAAVASDAMALFGIKAEDMKSAVDGITGVTIASKFGINDYALALAQGGGVAATSGVSFQDFNTTIAAISPYFASGADAGTSFKTMLQRIAAPTDTAMQAMIQLGLATADGKSQFYDASGQMKSMGEISGLLQTALSGLSEQQRTQALSTIFGSDAIRAASALAEAGTDKFNSYAGAIAKVDAEGSAATRMNTFSGQMEILQGVIDGLLTSIGMSFLPMLTDLTKWASQFMTDNGPAITNWFSGLAQWIRDITPAATQWGATLMAAMGEVASWLQGQDTSFGNLRKLWEGLTAAINSAIAAIVQYIRDRWPSWVATLQQWGQAAWQWVVDAMPTVMAKITALWTDLINYVIVNLPTWVANLKGWAAAAWQWIVDAMPTVLAKLGEWWTALSSYVVTNLPNWIENLKGWAAAAWQWVVDATPTVLAKLGELWSSISSWVTNPTKRTQLLGWLSGTWNGFSAWAGGLWNDTIKPAMAQLWLDLNAWIQKNMPILSPWLKSFQEFAQGAATQWAIEFPEMSQTIAHFVETTEGQIKRLQEAFASLFGGGGQPGSAIDAGASFTKMLGDILSLITGGLSNAAEATTAAVQGITKAVQALEMAIAGDFGGAQGKLGEAINDILRSLEYGINPFGRAMLEKRLNLPGLAGGGPVQAGMPYMVGELGPELFVPQTSGMIVPNNTTNSYFNINLAGSGQAGQDLMQTVQLMRVLYG